MPAAISIRDVHRSCALADPSTFTLVQFGAARAVACFEQAVGLSRVLGVQLETQDGCRIVSVPLVELPSCARMLHAKGLHLAFFAKVACPGGGAEYLRRSCNAFRELEEAHRIVFDDAIAELTDGRPDTGWSRWLLPVPRRPGIPDADACYALAAARRPRTSSTTRSWPRT